MWENENKINKKIQQWNKKKMADRRGNCKKNDAWENVMNRIFCKMTNKRENWSTKKKVK